tara:strand:+ start:916 stop:1113 length:198 start_codon:yes stop_codon:yes gene_type:complete
MKQFSFIFLILFIFISGPFVTIWSFNTLFDLGIEYTLKTWAAALILGGALYAPAVRRDKVSHERN